MKEKGILMREDGDLLVLPVKDGQQVIQSGLVVGNSVYQNQYIILTAHKGELKEFPMLGAGLPDMVHDHDIAGWGNEVRWQLQQDGMKVERVGFDRNMNLEIEASYGDR